MTGQFIDTLRFRWKSTPQPMEGYHYFETDFGKIRVMDTGGHKPVIVTVPDGPNVIEHQMLLLKELSKRYRVVSFEYPGLGFSYPNARFDYSFENGTKLLIQLMSLLKISHAALLFSCSNGFYALRAAQIYPDRLTHVFISQTPSTQAMLDWTKKSIPSLLNIPIIGQLYNAFFQQDFAEIWYRYSLPQNHPDRKAYQHLAKTSLNHGGCFCLASLVQGLKNDENTPLYVSGVPVTLVWGAKDFTHRNTDKETIKIHVKNCEIIEFSDCGHFPELEQTTDYVRLINERLNPKTLH